MTAQPRDVAEVLTEHVIECTGLGEVTCRGCRDRGWMTWAEYRRHVVAMLAAEGYPVTAAGLWRLRAKAWSEGYQDGWSDRAHPGEDRFRNPYRTEEDR